MFVELNYVVITVTWDTMWSSLDLIAVTKNQVFRRINTVCTLTTKLQDVSCFFFRDIQQKVCDVISVKVSNCKVTIDCIIAKSLVNSLLVLK